MSYFVAFCKSVLQAEEISNSVLDMLDHSKIISAVKIKHNSREIELPEQEVYISIWPADIFKCAGIRPDYVYFNDDCDYNFVNQYELIKRRTITTHDLRMFEAFILRKADRKQR